MTVGSNSVNFERKFSNQLLSTNNRENHTKTSPKMLKIQSPVVTKKYQKTPPKAPHNKKHPHHYANGSKNQQNQILWLHFFFALLHFRFRKDSHLIFLWILRLEFSLESPSCNHSIMKDSYTKKYESKKMIDK